MIKSAGHRLVNDVGGHLCLLLHFKEERTDAINSLAAFQRLLNENLQALLIKAPASLLDLEGVLFCNFDLVEFG